MNGPIKVADILKRPTFKNVKVVAGQSGLGRKVLWVHILDVPEVKSLIHGGELVLTTGIGFYQHKNGFYEYVNQLIQCKAAGLCLELGTFLIDVPSSVLELADEHQFPIILFPQRVKFVDITQDIHGLILSRHHKLIDDLEDLSRKLQQMTVNAMGTQHILQLVHQTTGHTVIYSRSGYKPIIIGAVKSKTMEMEKEWLNCFPSESEVIVNPKIVDLPEHSKSLLEHGQSVIAQSAIVLGISQGTLGLLVNKDQVDEYLLLVADRVTNALSLDEFRKLSLEERQMFTEQDWVERVVRDESPRVPTPFPSKPNSLKHYTVIMMNYPAASVHNNEPDDADPIATEEFDALNRKSDLSMMARLAFSKYRFRPYISIRDEIVIIVLEYETQEFSIKNRILAAIRQFKEALIHSGFSPEIRVSAGQEVGFKDIASSYKTASVAWVVCNKTLQQETLFYTEAGIYRWMVPIESDANIHCIVQGDLHSVLNYDKEHNADLFKTLKTYLDCDRSKQQTAEQLFIHRQTLYHRLKQLDELLQVDLEDPIQRLSLQLSIYFYLFQTSQN